MLSSKSFHSKDRAPALDMEEHLKFIIIHAYNAELCRSFLAWPTSLVLDISGIGHDRNVIDCSYLSILSPQLMTISRF